MLYKNRIVIDQEDSTGIKVLLLYDADIPVSIPSTTYDS